MRDDEPQLLDDVIAVENQIEVERTRRARVRAFAAQPSFDIEQRREEGGRRQRGVSDRGGVQESRLLPHAKGVGLVEGRHTQMRERGGECRDGLAQVPLAVTEIAPQGDGNRGRDYSNQRVDSTAP